MKKSSDTIRNRTRDLPACSALPQPTAPPRAPSTKITTPLLPQPLPQPATFLVTTMRIAETSSYGICYHKPTQPSSPHVLHVLSLVTHITPFRKNHLRILPSFVIFSSSTINFGFQCNTSLVNENRIDIYSVIQKDCLNFVRLYFLNYTWYVNDLHNI